MSIRWRAAIGFYRRAVELLGAPGAPELLPDRVAELWEKIGDLQALVGEHARQVEAYRAPIAALDGRAEHRLWLARLERNAAYACLGQHDAGWWSAP